MNSILAKMAVQIAANTSQFDKAMANTSKTIDGLAGHLKKTNSIISGFGSALGAVGLGISLGGIARSIFDIGVKSEQTAIAFNTFLGSAEKGKKLMGELSKFALITPFTTDQVNSAAKSLLAFGVEGNKILPTLKLIGDVSAGTGKDLSEMAIIFGQIRSTGRLMGQDLLQLINAGFNPLQIISEKTGKSMTVLKKEMEKGLISFDMVEQAFRDATSEGGLFFNLMEKQSQSVGGLLSTIAGNLEEISKKLFEANQGGVKDLTRGIADLTANTDGWVKAINALVESTGLFWLAKWASASKSAADETKRAKDEALQLQLVLAKADLDSAFTNEMRVNAIKRIIDLSKQLGQLPTGTTEDPLPWANNKKISTLRSIDDIIKSIQDRYNKLNSIARKKFEAPLKAEKLGDVTGMLAGTVGFNVKGIVDQFKTLPVELKPVLQDISDQFVEVGGVISGGISSIADAFGQAVIEGPKNFGRNFLMALAVFAQQFGSMLISIGVGEKALKVGGPGAKIAAGIALVALGGAVRALLSKPPSLSGGGSGAGGGSFSGASNPGSLFFNNGDRMPSIYLEARGNSLVAVTESTNLRNSRIRANSRRIS